MKIRPDILSSRNNPRQGFGDPCGTDVDFNARRTSYSSAVSLELDGT